MYSVERYLGHLKSLVCNKTRPEGSMAMGYMYEEALDFVTEHFRMYPVSARIIWHMEEDEQDVGEVLKGQGREQHWADTDLKEVHEHIIRHCDVTDSLYMWVYSSKIMPSVFVFFWYHALIVFPMSCSLPISSCLLNKCIEYQALQLLYERRHGRRFTSFSDWLEERVRDMGIAGEEVTKDLGTMSRLPSPYVRHHNSMWAYRYHFRADDERGRAHVSFDAGVPAIITQTCRSSRADRNPVEA